MITLIIILVILLCILTGGFFAGSETAFVSVDQLLISDKARKGELNARIAKSLLDEPSRLLTTTLVGTNISFVVATSLATIISRSYVSPHLQTLATAVVMTPLILIFAELVPKSLGRTNPHTYVLYAAPLLNIIQKSLTPAVSVISLLSNGILRLFGIREKKDAVSVTREELQILTDISAEQGLIGKAEHTMIQRVFELNTTPLSSVMAPLVELECIKLNASYEDVLSLAEDSLSSYYPVYEDRPDNIIGMVSVVDILNAAATEEMHHTTVPLGNLVDRTVPFIPETRMAGSLIREFKSSAVPVIFVVDEYGGVTGMITIQNLAEEVIGDLAIERPEQRPFLISHAAGIDCDGRVDIDTLSEKLGLLIDKNGYDTVAGLILSLAQRIPAPFESFTYKGFRFTVLRADRKRIIRVRITKI